jgi:hypothetical protein
MSYTAIRAVFEAALNTAYQGLTTPVPVLFDNVQETQPNGEHVILSIGFPSSTEPLVCSTGETNIEFIRGSIQVSCYVPRGRGMKRLEELAAVALQTLVAIPQQADPNKICPRVGNIEGPTPILSGDEPYGLSVVSAVFTARG